VHGKIDERPDIKNFVCHYSQIVVLYCKKDRDANNFIAEVDKTKRTHHFIVISGKQDDSRKEIEEMFIGKHGTVTFIDKKGSLNDDKFLIDLRHEVFAKIAALNHELKELKSIQNIQDECKDEFKDFKLDSQQKELLQVQ
jgi:hypothetical protein